VSLVWLNGVLIDAGVARIDPGDRGFTLGDGVFETIRAVDGAPVHVARHFSRLRRGAAVLGMEMPLGDDMLFDALFAVLRANDLTEAALRLTLTRGPAARGVLPAGAGGATVLISAGAAPGAAGPARMIVSEQTRRNEFSPLSRIKSLNYLDSILARMEAAAQGADDAILLNTQGNWAEATAANVFLWLDGQFVTPPVSDGALPGVARGRLLDAGLVMERTVTRAALDSVETGFLANSLGVRPISGVGDVVFDARHQALTPIASFLMGT
jgi:branched-chain amino acid aminotransferase